MSRCKSRHQMFRLMLLLFVSAAKAMFDPQFYNCHLKRGGSDDILALIHDPIVNIVSVEMIVGKEVQLVFNYPGNQSPQCSSVKRVMNSPPPALTRPRYLSWTRNQAAQELGFTSLATRKESCSAEFPLVLVQEADFIEVDCLNRGLGDSIITFHNTEPAADTFPCLEVLDASVLDEMCRNLSMFANSFQQEMKKFDERYLQNSVMARRQFMPSDSEESSDDETTSRF